MKNPILPIKKKEWQTSYKNSENINCLLILLATDDETINK